ncbi:Dihydrofolate reductase [Chitinophaga sp. CF118]|uniref:dihydrofolate reductase family protein n=1 Tax=Chitinophaga sp. CF118 TaxID=1884367 RepID=UPI0008E81B1B|nr:dihydrofolate reductase family protein [Chitinophaga sp. CF118]SFE96514.1 Dihydrofolate reductase [Chitinophaga sp. CF118]
MRKVVLSMNVTLDGFMAGPNCELDWHFENWAPDMAASLCEQLSKADTIILGRVTYSAMARYWPGRATDMSFPREDLAFAEMMNSYKKIVFSKNMSTPVWNNSRFVKGNLRRVVLQLKRQEGKDIIIYGSGQLVASLIQLELIDEYLLWMHPVVLGKGKPLFRELQDKLNMKLVKLETFRSGVVVLYYENGGIVPAEVPELIAQPALKKDQ